MSSPSPPKSPSNPLNRSSRELSANKATAKTFDIVKAVRQCTAKPIGGIYYPDNSHLTRTTNTGRNVKLD